MSESVIPFPSSSVDTSRYKMVEIDKEIDPFQVLSEIYGPQMRDFRKFIKIILDRVFLVVPSTCDMDKFLAEEVYQKQVRIWDRDESGEKLNITR